MERLKKGMINKMEWNTYEELQTLIDKDNKVLAPAGLYDKIKSQLNYQLEYAEDRVNRLHEAIDGKLYANCLSSEKFKSQQVKSTSSPLSDSSGSYTHHLDKLADYILFSSFDNLEDRQYSERLREEKKQLLKKSDTEKRKKDLLVNRDKQTTRLGRLVNKRESRSFREDESFSLDLGATDETFYQTNNIEPVHYTHVDKELNQKKVFKNSFNYWVHYGRHNQTGMRSIFNRVDYSTPYFMVAFESLSNMNEGITNTLKQIENSKTLTERKKLEKLKREQTEDYNLASQILRNPVVLSMGSFGRSTDSLTLNEEKVDYTNKEVIKAIIYGFAEFKQYYSTETSTLHWAIIQDFEEAFQNIKLSKIQQLVAQEVINNANWSYNDIIYKAQRELNKEYSTSGIAYHINGVINRVLQYFIEKELENE